jgi:hypothetical protein
MSKNMSLLNTRLPGLLPRVVWTPALMVCIAIDSALSHIVLHLQYFAKGCHVVMFLERFLLFDAFFHTQHWIVDFFQQYVHISDVTIL